MFVHNPIIKHIGMFDYLKTLLPLYKKPIIPISNFNVKLADNNFIKRNGYNPNIKMYLIYDNKINNNDKYIGIIGLGKHNGNLSIGPVYLNESYRGYKIGKQMVDIVIDDAKKMKANELHLESIINHPFWMKVPNIKCEEKTTYAKCYFKI